MYLRGLFGDEQNLQELPDDAKSDAPAYHLLRILSLERATGTV